MVESRREGVKETVWGNFIDVDIKITLEKLMGKWINWWLTLYVDI